MKTNHPFHMVTPSPWPFILSTNIFNMFMSTILYIYMKNTLYMYFSMFLMILSLLQWWRDIVRESTYQGFHTFMILKMLKLSMTMFILSELFFFVSFFWAFFHSSMSPSIEIGMNWPPKNILSFNPNDIPLFNSLILISSGFSVTWSHHSLIFNKMKNSKKSLFLTIILGINFTLFQMMEYFEAPFCINDSIYGSIFFMTTGFHGIHVIIGTILLLTCLIRMNKNHLSSIHHFHFEAAAWYWHFVDMIWLFVYLSIYWWMY